jgi:amidase
MSLPALAGPRRVVHDDCVVDDLAELDACGQAERVRSGAVTSAELVEAAVRRCERLAPQLHALVADCAAEGVPVARGRGSWRACRS